MSLDSQAEDRNGFEIAVIGMAGRFPQAENVEAFWRNLCAGLEAVHFFTHEELRQAGVSEAALARPDYVKARAVLAGAERFDAEFFGFTQREAEITDPQHRLFLECSWEALEDAGYDSLRYPGDIGIYAGAGLNTYAFVLYSRPEIMQAVGMYQAFLATDKDFLATRAAYKLNLTGPSLSVQTACSTSLVAVHLACQALNAGECQIALAGGVSVSFPQQVGYLYEEGGILSPDGHCRAFDAQAAGTVSGNGLGIVVLKRLDEALADGDRVLAVIKGTAINNDGSKKIGYTAPSVEGQAKVIRMAQAIAGVDPSTISYVEAHGTATALGDPIEIAGLRKAFADAAGGRCALGSVKTNVGHLDTAAGVTGLIKTVLALERGLIPPSLHFSELNPRIDLQGTPFYVNDRLAEWDSNGSPRRAGVSSFGIGGTNAHAVLEQAPPLEPSGPSRPWQLLLLSARTEAALERMTGNLVEHLRSHPDLSLPDTAYTLQVGRRRFGHRRALVCRDLQGAVDTLGSLDPEVVLTRFQEEGDRPVAFLFPGQGAQSVNMGLELYREEELFRQQVDLCCEHLRPHLGLDLRDVLYPAAGMEEDAARELEQTALAQPALFTIEYALARLWMDWGVRPDVMLGHSLGEYVAACLAGVFTLEDALSLVAARGRLMQSAPAGAMLAVSLPEDQVVPLLDGSLALAAVNGPGLSVVSGDMAALARLEAELAAQGHETRRLLTSHAFHSATMDPILEPFAREVRKLRPEPPRIPYFSNLTGQLVQPEEAIDPEYWVRHLRQTVRFGDGLRELLREPNRVLLEVGPGRTLSSLARRHPDCPAAATVVSSLPHPREPRSASESLLTSLGRLWLAGLEIDWTSFYAREQRRRVGLPTYPFERKAYWIEPRAIEPAVVGEAPAALQDPAPEETAGKPGPAPSAGSRPTIDTPYSAPREGDEQVIAAVWEELLGFPVGRHDNFFELGGHSLAATRMAARLRAALHLDLPLRELLEKPTVASMAAVAARRKQAGEGMAPTELPACVPDPAQRHEPFPLTDVQQAYWLGRSDAFELGNVATHNYLELESESLDLQRFTSALRRLIERHDMLRAIMLQDGRQQILAQVPPYEVAALDLRSADPEEARDALEATREEMSHQVLPSGHWPLFEVRAALLPGSRIRLHISFDFLIGDAWSWQLLLSELAWLYAAPERPLPPLSLSFRDYVLLDADLVRTELYERSSAYWQARLPSFPLGPELPLARDVGSLSRPSFVRRFGKLDAEAWQRLKARATREGLTPSGLIAAAFSEVLALWSKTPHFTLNLTLFNRLPVHPEVNQVLGDFTSLTLLEVDNRGRAPFRARALRLQSRLWEDLDHRYFSGVRVLRELARSRGSSGRVSMPVVFTSTLTMAQTGQDASLESLPEMRTVYSISQTPQVWLDHQVAEKMGVLVFNWDAVEELFPPGLLDDMFQSYQNLLARLAEGDEAWQSESAAEELIPAWQLELVRSVNATESPLPATTLHQLFLDQALRQPDRPAVVAPGRSLTYGELDRLSQGLARRLLALGARPGQLVAVVMEKGWEQVAAVLAVVRAGAAYLPIDPGLPVERVHQLLAQGEVRLALTQPSFESALEWPGDVVRVAVGDAPPEDGTEGGLEARGGPADLAYVIFTSGSTGVPKGVMIDHRGAVNTVLDINRRFGVGAGDRVLALSSLSFDLSVWDIFGLLAAGGAIVVPDPWAARDPGRWLELMEAEGVTVWNSVPALLEMLVEHVGARTGSVPGPLRLVMLSGDWIPVGLPDRLRSMVSRPVTLIGMGGATEASIWSIFYPIEQVDPGWTSIPYGKPLANQTFHVLDDGLRQRPSWVPGELYIGGIGVALGYWRDPEKTGARFLEHPLTGERLYRTGDLGRYLPDGNIEFQGREDLQVKIQGYRVELGEIDAALARHPGVQAAVAAAVGEPRRGRRLIAYVVLSDRGVTAADLESHLRERLPSYMVPTGFVFLDALPLTANGKVDRGALPAHAASAERVDPAITVASPTQEILIGLWADLLGVASVGLNDNFFELGGDSLQAIRVVSRIREVFRVEVPLRRLFDSPTVADLAALLDQALLAGRGLVAPPILPRPRAAAAPLSYAQQRLWFLDRLQPGDPAYNIPSGFRLSGRFSPALLERCVGEIVRRHEALRTRFLEIDGQPVQVVDRADGVFPVPVVDLGALPETDREPEARRLLDREARLPFDLTEGSLLRIRLFRLQDDDHLAAATLHHIVSDAWSMGVMMQELAALYGAFAAGLPSPLPELPVQYADYSEWQREWLTGDVMETALDYWRQRFEPRPAALSLPVDRPRVSAASSGAGHWRFHLSRQATGELRALSRSTDTTLFMSLLAGFTALLQRYTHQEDLVVGTPVANRGRREVEGLIGCFINMLALRSDLSGDPAFTELSHRVREVTLGGVAHQDLPFDKLVEELQPERDLTRSPLFQVLFVLQNAPMPESDLPGLRLAPVRIQVAATQYDLTLTMVEEEEGLAASFEYAADLFEPATVQRMAAHFERLLGVAVAGPSSRISELPLLSSAEERQLLETESPAAPSVARLCVHELFERQALRAPDAVAVVFGENRLTYGDLDRQADRLAARLAALGVQPGDRVGVSLPRSERMIVALLGILKSGAAYVPLDPEYPVERLRWMVEDSGISILVTDSPMPERFGPEVRQLDLREEAEAVESVPGRAALEGPAYVIYTSGSTGRPKGVEIGHRALSSFVQVAAERYGIGSDDRVLQFASINFDTSAEEIYPCLARGGTVVLRTPDMMGSTAHFLELCERWGITVLDLPTAFWHQLARSLAEEGLEVPPGLRLVILGGEAARADVLELWRERVPRSVRVVNSYGPTEATIVSTLWELEAPEDTAGPPRAVPIGRAIEGARAYVLDPRGLRVPANVPGELCLGGDHLAFGYLRAPETTAAKFLPDPFSDRPGARLYRTGDLVRRLADGNLEFLGRIDQQVKIRGYRIELGEIEARLSRRSGVREAVAVAREDGRGERRLVAYVVPEAGAALAAAELQEALRGELPGHMVPAEIVFLESLPLTPSCKVDRAALPAPDAAASRNVAAAHLQGPVEEILAGLWSDLLGTAAVGSEDNFFDLGGHSLLATQLLSRVRRAFGVEVPLRELFDRPTVAGLARAIQARRLLRDGGGPPPITRIPRGARLPASFAQQRLWFLDRLNPESSAYNISTAALLAGRLDVRCLAKVLTEITRRHESLRTRIETWQGLPYQVIDPPVPVELPVVDLTALEPGSRENHVVRLASEDARRPFALARGPLWRFTLVRLGEESHAVILTLHHIISDGWSLRLFLGEVQALYLAFAAGQESPLPEPELQYADFALWQRSWLQGEELERQLAFWRRHLDGAPRGLSLPLDRPRPAFPSLQGAIEKLALSSELSRALRALSREEGATLFMILLAGFKTLLYRYSGQSDIVVSAGHANRNYREVEDLIGFFVNTLPLRTDLSGEPTFRQVLRQVRKVTLEANEHQDVPFEQIVEALQPERSSSHAPLSPVVFDLDSMTSMSLSGSGLAMSSLQVDRGTAKVDLVFMLRDREEGISGELEYSTELFERTTIVRMLRHYEQILASVAADPDLPLLDIPLDREDWQAAAPAAPSLAPLEQDQFSFEL